jgi:hypothetical protein
MRSRWAAFYFVAPKFDADRLKSNAEFAAAVEDYVLRVRDFYDSRARWHRRLYRFSTILLILIGASLPVAASLSYPGKVLWLSILGVAVAAITALRSFYHWDQFWVLLRTTETRITKTYLEWKASVPELLGDGTDIAVSKKSAGELVDRIYSILGNEAEQFFRALADRRDFSK